MENGQSDVKFASDPTPFAFANECVDGGYYVLVTGVENREFNMRELRFCSIRFQLCCGGNSSVTVARRAELFKVLWQQGLGWRDSPLQIL